MIIYRSASEQDLAQCYEIVYFNEIRGERSPLPLPPVSNTLMHIFRNGNVVVAEEDGRVLAYAGTITREHVTYLTDLFVRPDLQSAGLGQTLLRQVLPEVSGQIHCTMSSTDQRALALYIRAGMRPLWPNFNLRLDDAMSARRMRADVEIVEAIPGEPPLLEWDTRACGRQRPQEHVFWVQEQGGVPLWFRRGREILGYGYVRLGASTFWTPRTCILGPIGARSSEDALTCVLAAVGWAQQRANVLHIDVPGPHPCLASLLEARFRITYVETHLSSAPAPFFDACCSIASGSDLF